MVTLSEVSVSKDADMLDHNTTMVAPSTDSSEISISEKTEETFKPGWRFIAAFLSMCVIVLMAALDATSISVGLPVYTPLCNRPKQN